jgi:hypothetical protein
VITSPRATNLQRRAYFVRALSGILGRRLKFRSGETARLPVKGWGGPASRAAYAHAYNRPTHFAYYTASLEMRAHWAPAPEAGYHDSSSKTFRATKKRVTTSVITARAANNRDCALCRRRLVMATDSSKALRHPTGLIASATDRFSASDSSGMRDHRL